MVNIFLEENKPNKKPNRNQFQKGKTPLAVPNSRVRKGADLPDESIAEERWVRPKYNFDSLPPAQEEKNQNENGPEEEEKPKKKKRGGGLGQGSTDCFNHSNMSYRDGPYDGWCVDP